MFECIEPSDFETEAMFLNFYPWDKYVLVQNDGLYRVLKKFFNEKNVIIKGFNGSHKGREAVINALNTFSDQARFIGIINAEYNRIMDDLSDYNLDNILTTDYYDLNAQIFYSKALERYIEMFMEDPKKIEIDKIREICINIAGYFQFFMARILRCIDKEEFKNILNNPEFNIEKHFDEKDFCMENREIMSKILKIIKSSIKKCENIDSEEIKDVEKALDEVINDEFQAFILQELAKGKDLLKIFSKMMLFKINNLENTSLSDDSIAFFRNLERFQDLIKRIENTLKGYYGINEFIESNLCLQLYKAFKPFLDDELIKKIETNLKKEKLIGYVSHSSRDFQFFEIERVAKRLEQRKEIDKIIYFEDRSGKDFVEDMNKYIDQSDFLLLFCSPNAFESYYVNCEWRSALALKKRIFPVFVEEKHIPIILSSTLGERFRKDDIEGFIDSLHVKIKKETFIRRV